MAIACRDADQAREIKALAEEGIAGAGMFGKASGRKSSGSPRFAGRSNQRRLLRPRRPFHLPGVAAQRLPASGPADRAAAAAACAAMRRIVSEP